MTKVLVADKLHEDGVRMLREFADVEVATGLKPEELIKKVKDVDVLVVRGHLGEQRS